MRLLLTGATGFIGQHLAARLLDDRDVSLTLLLREPYADSRPLPPPLAAGRADYDVVYADLRNFRLTARAVSQAAPDTIIHLAAAGPTDPFLGVDVALRHNLNGTINLLRACFESSGGVQQFIVARTPGERSAMNVYAASKAAAWQFCQMFARTHDWPIHGAMIYQAYGPGQPAQTLIPAAARAALDGRDFPLTSGRQERDWIFVGDAADGLAAMLRADLERGGTTDLGTGETTAVADVVRRIYALAGGRSSRSRPGGGRPLVGALTDRPGETPRQVADAAATAARLGWRAATSLDDGLRRTLDALS